MAYSATAIRTTCIELLEGTIGTTRTVTAAKFKHGAFRGQPDQALIAKTIQTTTGRHWFDVVIGKLMNHPSTSVSATGNRRIGIIDVRFDLWTHLSTTAQESQRKTDLAAIESDADMAIQAMHFPDNVKQTSAAVVTNIVSGMLFGPGGNGAPVWQEDEQDWRGLQVLRSHIEATAILTITQAV